MVVSLISTPSQSSIRVRRDLLHEKHAATMNVLVQERGAREREISYLKQQCRHGNLKIVHTLTFVPSR